MRSLRFPEPPGSALRGRWLLLALALGLIGACDAGGAPLIAAGDFCDDVARMACGTAERCDCLGGFSATTCVPFARARCAEGVEEPVRAGRRTWDPGRAGQCYADLMSLVADCSTEGDDWPMSCDGMLVAAVAPGDACEDDADCTGAHECWSDRCTRMPVAGEPCLEGDACADDHFCGPGSVCVAERGRGESCAEDGSVCADDLHCDSRGETCQPELGQGEPCGHASSVCADDLYCSLTTAGVINKSGIIGSVWSAFSLVYFVN